MKPYCTLLIILLLFLTVGTYYVWKGEFKKRYAPAGYSPSCSMTVPPEFHLVYSPVTQRYAIKNTEREYTDQYLCQPGYDIQLLEPFLAKAKVFKDSCEAKAFLQECLNQQMVQYK